MLLGGEMGDEQQRGGEQEYLLGPTGLAGRTVGLSPQGDERGEAIASTAIPPGKRPPSLHFVKLVCLPV